MSEIEIEPSSQQAPFGAAGGTKYDTVSAVYEKRGPEIHHRQYCELLL